MSESKKNYKLNPETLLYEMEKVSSRWYVGRILAMIFVSVSLSFVFMWVFTSVLGMELPKTVLLKKQNARWVSRMEVMNRKLDNYESLLNGLSLRDNEIYRNIFGMNEIGPEIRNAGYSGTSRYEDALAGDASPALVRTSAKIDRLMKKAYVQSRSFDAISALSKRAGDMVSCIPAVPPINPDPSTYRRSSSFGYRSDPFTGGAKMHTGMDFACPKGNPVYVTGDGVVEKVSYELFGYGYSVLVDHGFGYKTRYAHLNNIFVTEGMKLKRGECIAETGNTGRSSGPHLHYEVIYRERYVNPANFLDLEMPQEEFMTMVRKAEAESKNVIVRPNQRIKR